MSVIVALTLGLGVFLVFDGLTRDAPRSRRRRMVDRLVGWLAAGGLGHVRPMQFVLASACAGLAACAVTVVVIGSAGVALVAMLGARRPRPPITGPGESPCARSAVARGRTPSS